MIYIYCPKPFFIIGLQINNILILAEKLFTVIKKHNIKMTNIVKKKYIYLNHKIFFKFNNFLN